MTFRFSMFLLALLSFLVYSCDDDGDILTIDGEPSPIEAFNNGLVELTEEEFELMSESISAFTHLSHSIKNTAKSDQFPSSVIQAWEDSVLVTAPHEFAFREVKKGENGNFLVPDGELARAELYLDAFEPLFNAMESAFESGKATDELTLLLTNFQNAVGVVLLNGKNDSSEKLFGRKRRYCCCCVEAIGNFGQNRKCKSYRTRRWWANVKCKILRRIFGGCREVRLYRGNCNGRG